VFLAIIMLMILLLTGLPFSASRRKRKCQSYDPGQRIAPCSHSYGLARRQVSNLGTAFYRFACILNSLA
jgi:hypothetical protein